MTAEASGVAGAGGSVPMVTSRALRDRVNTSGSIWSRALFVGLANEVGATLYDSDGRLLVTAADADKIAAAFLLRYPPRPPSNSPTARAKRVGKRLAQARRK